MLFRSKPDTGTGQGKKGIAKAEEAGMFRDRADDFSQPPAKGVNLAEGRTAQQRRGFPQESQEAGQGGRNCLQNVFGPEKPAAAGFHRLPVLHRFFDGHPTGQAGNDGFTHLLDVAAKRPDEVWQNGVGAPAGETHKTQNPYLEDATTIVHLTLVPGMAVAGTLAVWANQRHRLKKLQVKGHILIDCRAEEGYDQDAT